MPMYWVVVYSSMPSEPPSRPRPDCFTPPNGAAALEMTPALKPDHAEFDLLGHAQAAVEVRGCRCRRPGRIRWRWPAAMASSSVAKVVIGATGPKISWRRISASLGDVGQHGGLVEVAGPVDRCAAGDGGGTGVDGGGDQGVDVVAGAGVDQRADLGVGLGAAAGGQGAHRGGELGGELRGDGLVDEEAVGGGAGLAHVAHLGGHGPFDGLIQVGVLEHDERGVAAELHGGAQHVLGGVGDEPLADRGGTGEGDLAQPGVLRAAARRSRRRREEETTFRTPAGRPASSMVWAKSWPSAG